MWDNYIGTHIRRANRNLLLVNAGLLLLLALCAGVSERYWQNFFRGPRPISVSSLIAVQDPDKLAQYYVTVNGEKCFDTDVTEVEQSKDKYSGTVRSEHTTAHYLLLKVGDKALLVKANDAALNTEFKGALVPIPLETRGHTIDKLAAENPKLADRFLPMMLDATDFKTEGYIGLAVGTPLFALALWNVLKALRRGSESDAHPILKTLGAYGDPRDVSAQIDNDMRMGAQSYGAAALSQNWLTQRKTFGLDVQRVEDIAWAYKKVTQHRTNFIPTGKTFAAVICDRNGGVKEVSGSAKNIDALLNGLGARLPWIAMGFDKELQTWWAKDRAGLIAAVDQRRQDMTA